mmetsp:Transcript_34545/g.95527  ORF Transcript_34545/g.95527 Transcript_34545/m.95527 type:complete len:291 (+) Transcript_34545:753-1625(+)
MLFVEAAARRLFTACCTVSLGSSPSMTAMAPEMCGQAMEVPLMNVRAASWLWPADRMRLPGAKMSTHLPQLLKPDRESVFVLEATVTAFGTYAGEKLQASASEFPAATTTTTPLLTAASTVILAPLTLFLEPRLALATAGLLPLRAIQSKAPVNQDHWPFFPRTLTACKVAPLATPWSLPPIVPAQCVPWPFSSSAQEVSVARHTRRLPEVMSIVGIARPPKSLCVVRMPVSMTYTCTPLPASFATSYVPSSPFSSSMRSRPHESKRRLSVPMWSESSISVSGSAKSAPG